MFSEARRGGNSNEEIAPPIAAFPLISLHTAQGRLGLELACKVASSNKALPRRGLCHNGCSLAMKRDIHDRPVDVNFAFFEAVIIQQSVNHRVTSMVRKIGV